VITHYIHNKSYLKELIAHKLILLLLTQLLMRTLLSSHPQQDHVISFLGCVWQGSGCGYAGGADSVGIRIRFRKMFGKTTSPDCLK
jgi:hypothetical protein